MKESVQKALDKIRPNLQADGGDVELVDVSDGGIVTGSNVFLSRKSLR